MAKNMNTIVYGKVQIAAESPIEKLVTILDNILKKHGYPESTTESVGNVDDNSKDLEDIPTIEDMEKQSEESKEFISSM